MTPEEYKKLSVKEFTQAAKIYDSGHVIIEHGIFSPFSRS